MFVPDAALDAQDHDAPAPDAQDHECEQMGTWAPISDVLPAAGSYAVHVAVSPFDGRLHVIYGADGIVLQHESGNQWTEIAQARDTRPVDRAAIGWVQGVLYAATRTGDWVEIRRHAWDDWDLIHQDYGSAVGSLASSQQEDGTWWLASTHWDAGWRTTVVEVQADGLVVDRSPSWSTVLVTLDGVVATRNENASTVVYEYVGGTWKSHGLVSDRSLGGYARRTKTGGLEAWTGRAVSYGWSEYAHDGTWGVVDGNGSVLGGPMTVHGVLDGKPLLLESGSVYVGDERVETSVMNVVTVSWDVDECGRYVVAVSNGSEMEVVRK